MSERASMSDHGRPYPRWHVCHHCQGARCEVCEDAGGWYETASERQARLLMWRAGRAERERQRV